MLFMIVERIRNRNPLSVYQRFEESGRMMPAGLTYVDSWVEANFDRVFQLMECDDPALLQEWILAWGDLIDFELIPVVPSKSTVELMQPHLNRAEKRGD